MAQAQAILDVEQHLLARAQEQRQELGNEPQQHGEVAGEQSGHRGDGRGPGQQTRHLARAAVDEPEQRLVATGRLAVEDREIGRVELLGGIAHRVDSGQCLGEVRRGRSRELGATAIEAVDVAAARIGRAAGRCRRRRAFVDLAPDLARAILRIIEANLVVEAAIALGLQR